MKCDFEIQNNFTSTKADWISRFNEHGVFLHKLNNRIYLFRLTFATFRKLAVLQFSVHWLCLY
jgi:hypothetical protein